MPDLDVSALAEKLADTAANLDAHIETRAWEIARPQIEAVKASAAERERELAAEAEGWEQRHGDLRREIQRQQKPLERQFAELKELRELRKRVVQRLVICATGPDGERYAPYDALIGAIWPEKDKEPPK